MNDRPPSDSAELPDLLSSRARAAYADLQQRPHVADEIDPDVLAELTELHLVTKSRSTELLVATPALQALPQALAFQAQQWLAEAPRFARLAEAIRHLTPISPVDDADALMSEAERDVALEVLVQSARQSVRTVQPFAPAALETGADSYLSSADPVFPSDVECRYVYDSRLLAVDGFIPLVHEEIGLGAQVRVSRDPLPGFLVIIDDRAAAFAPHSEGAGQISTADRLVQFLIHGFEHIWSQAMPFGRERSIADDQQALMALVGLGFNNKEIAARLDVHTRTVQRRIDQLLDHFNVPDRSALIRVAVDSARDVSSDD